MSVDKIKSLNLPDDATVCISYSEGCDVLHCTGEGESYAIDETSVSDFIVSVLKSSHDNNFPVWDWAPSNVYLNDTKTGCAQEAISTWKDMKEMEGQWPLHPEDNDTEWYDNPDHPEYINELATYNSEINEMMKDCWTEVMQEYQEYWLPLDVSVEHYDHKRGFATVKSDIHMKASDYVAHGPFGEQSVSVETEMGTLTIN